MNEKYIIKADHTADLAAHKNEIERLERERDEWIGKAVELCAERESNAMQALAYKAERDKLAEALQNLCDSFLGNKSSRDITAQLVEAGKALAALNQQEP